MADLETSAITEVANPSEVEPSSANESVGTTTVTTVTETDTNIADSNVASDSSSEVSATDDKAPQSAEENAKYASIRRKAEEEAKAKYEKQIASINDKFKRQFGNYKIPGTDKQIETFEDYLQAVELQQKEAREEELRAKGVDPKIIEDMVNNSPSMIRANEIIKEQEQRNINARLAEDFKVVQGLNPNLKTMEDLVSEPNYSEVVKYVNSGLSLPDAYKLANFDSIASRKLEATKQATINAAKSTSHLQTSNGLATPSDTMTPIPASQLQLWKNSFPGLSMEQLTAEYNKFM